MTLLTKLKDRELNYTKATADIVESLGPNLTKAVLKIINSNEIEWRGVSLHSGFSECVAVDGVAYIAIGKTITTKDGEVITITEENRNGYRQVFGFIFPIILIEYGSVEDITNYIQDILNTELPEVDANLLKSLTDELLVEASTDKDDSQDRMDNLKNAMQSNSTEDKIPDSDITAEQVKAMLLFRNLRSESIH